MTDQKLVLSLAVPVTKTNQTYEKKKKKKKDPGSFRHIFKRVKLSFSIFRLYL